MQNFTAKVTDIETNAAGEVEGMKLVVTGHNLSTELITMLAQHAASVELGWGLEDLVRSLRDWDVEEGTESSTVTLSL